MSKSIKPYGPLFYVASDKARARSRGVCQFCGDRMATKGGHHWAGGQLSPPYMDHTECTPDDLTSLCQPCHDLATTLRRFVREGGGDIWQFTSIFREAIRQCDTKSPSRVLADSSCTTARLDSTPVHQPTSKRRRLPGSVGATAPRPTTSDLPSSNARPVFGSTWTERRQSRKEPSDQ